MQLRAGGQRSVSQRGRPITCQYTVVTATRATIRFEPATVTIDKNSIAYGAELGIDVSPERKNTEEKMGKSLSDSHLWQMGRLRAGELPGPPVPVGHV